MAAPDLAACWPVARRPRRAVVAFLLLLVSSTGVAACAPSPPDPPPATEPAPPSADPSPPAPVPGPPDPEPEPSAPEPTAAAPRSAIAAYDLDAARSALTAAEQLAALGDAAEPATAERRRDLELQVIDAANRGRLRLPASSMSRSGLAEAATGPALSPFDLTYGRAREGATDWAESADELLACTATPNILGTAVLVQCPGEPDRAFRRRGWGPWFDARSGWRNHPLRPIDGPTSGGWLSPDVLWRQADPNAGAAVVFDIVSDASPDPALLAQLETFAIVAPDEHVPVNDWMPCDVDGTLYWCDVHALAASDTAGVPPVAELQGRYIEVFASEDGDAIAAVKDWDSDAGGYPTHVYAIRYAPFRLEALGATVVSWMQGYDRPFGHVEVAFASGGALLAARDGAVSHYDLSAGLPSTWSVPGHGVAVSDDGTHAGIVSRTDEGGTVATLYQRCAASSCGAPWTRVWSRTLAEVAYETVWFKPGDNDELLLEQRAYLMDGNTQDDPPYAIVAANGPPVFCERGECGERGSGVHTRMIRTGLDRHPYAHWHAPADTDASYPSWPQWALHGDEVAARWRVRSGGLHVDIAGHEHVVELAPTEQPWRDRFVRYEAETERIFWPRPQGAEVVSVSGERATYLLGGCESFEHVRPSAGAGLGRADRAIPHTPWFAARGDNRICFWLTDVDAAREQLRALVDLATESGIEAH